jgi:hypothetical protein
MNTLANLESLANTDRAEEVTGKPGVDTAAEGVGGKASIPSRDRDPAALGLDQIAETFIDGAGI